MKRKFLIIIIATLLPVAIVILLTALSNAGQPGKGGFTRNYTQRQLTLVANAELSVSDMFIAGLHNRKILLGHPVDVHRLLSFDQQLKDSQVLHINTHPLGIAHLGVSTRIQGLDVFQIEAITPSILRANIDSLKFSRINTPVKRFTSAVPLSTTSFVARVFDNTLKQDVLVKFIGNRIDSARVALRRQGDGQFSLDGILTTDEKTGNVFYIYYYRNEFVCLDSNLHIRYTANTIDTVSTVKLRLEEIKSDHSVNLAMPPPFVNKRAMFYNGNLYILSAIPADNDLVKIRQAVPVDIYDGRNGKYRESFYIPHLDGDECKSFHVVEDTVIAIYKQRIAIYSFAAPRIR